MSWDILSIDDYPKKLRLHDTSQCQLAYNTEYRHPRRGMNSFFVRDDQIDTHMNSVMQAASKFATIMTIVGRLYTTTTVIDLLFPSLHSAIASCRQPAL